MPASERVHKAHAPSSQGLYTVLVYKAVTPRSTFPPVNDCRGAVTVLSSSHLLYMYPVLGIE